MKLIAPTAAGILLLAGCASPATPHDPEPREQAPCQVGHWELDVADYAAQSEAFLGGFAFPIVDFAMEGSGQLDIGADGFMDGVVSLVTSGIISVPERNTPFTTPSSYTFSGNWATGTNAGTMDLSNWATVPDPGVVVNPASPAVPAFDLTDVPSVTSECTADSLRLQGPDAPLSALWHRGS